MGRCCTKSPATGAALHTASSRRPSTTGACSPAGSATQEAAGFPALLARFQAGDTTADVRALRMAYTRTEAYDPYGSADAEALGAMWEQLRAARLANAARAAEALRARDWLDIAPHVVAEVAYTGQGADSAAALHAFAVRALVGSIGGPEDGRSPEAPMHVIDVAEEYAWLNDHGLRAQRQGLGRCARSRCDSFPVRDEGGKEFQYTSTWGSPTRGCSGRWRAAAARREKRAPDAKREIVLDYLSVTT